ncbi:asparagine synthase (glutamine-hydrolyzing) [Fundidesulfovibrio butyratiphilus]
MCGIVGYLASKDRAADREILAAMAGSIAYRGPDGQGIHTDGRLGLGHRRLAIIDLATGDQPMQSVDGSLWIVFNGEIYNFQSLRTELETTGHRFATRSDTEVILAAYRQWGPACLERLRGMFALALWDQREKRLFLARDRMGKKPLYYARVDGAFVFASEIAALLAYPGLSREIDCEAVGLYLGLQYVPDPLSAFKAIRKLPPGHCLALDEHGQERVERYHTPAFEPKWTADEEHLCEQLRTTLSEAVRLRLIADVPLGAHLSGGVDSSIVTALMAEHADAAVKTFSIGFREQGFSELPKARLVAERYGCEHHEFIVDFGHVPDALTRVAAHCGEPFADPSALPSLFLARMTRGHVTVALNGDGGDELFAGYQRYWLDPLAAPYAALPRFVTQELVPALAGLLPRGADRPIETDWAEGFRRLAQVAAISDKASILRWGSYFAPWQARELWREDVRPQADAERWLANAFDQARAKTFLDRTLACDQACYLPGDLLVKADRMAMAHSLEGRSPLLDQDLAAFAARLPARMKLRGRRGKYLLRKAFAHLLPPEVLAQGKQGFGVPVSTWLREDLHAWCRERLLHGEATRRLFRAQPIVRLLDEHRAGKADHGKRLWALLSLEEWLRTVVRP